MKIKFLKTITCIFLISFAFIPVARSQDSGDIAVTVTIAEQTAGVRIRVSPRLRRTRPGRTVTLWATVRNTGDGDDYFKLTTLSSLGWEVEFPDGDTVGPIKPGRRKRVRVRVVTPEDAERGERNKVTVTATSQYDPSVSDSASSTILVR